MGHATLTTLVYHLGQGYSTLPVYSMDKFEVYYFSFFSIYKKWVIWVGKDHSSFKVIGDVTIRYTILDFAYHSIIAVY